MLLSALTDFPDDALNIYYESTMYQLMERLKSIGVSRVYMQYYGNKEYGYFWDHNAPSHRNTIKTADNMNEFNKVYAKAAKANGLETAAVMRPHEQGLFITYSPYHKEVQEHKGLPYIGGKIMIASKFLLENPDLRIKRRTWDIDKEAINKDIHSIKLYKQNNIHSQIKKENIAIYVSGDNANYKKYEGAFSFSYSMGKATRDAVISSFKVNYPTENITHKGDEVEVITLSEMVIKEQFVAIAVSCDKEVSEENAFSNTVINGIAIFDKEQKKICASPGSVIWKLATEDPPLQSGFNFDDGFGANFKNTLDKKGETGYIAIAKGKDEYVHGALCVLEPKVREYWFKWLEKAMDDGYDLIGNRIECHSVHVDEPYAYGYNDCIKEEYFKRYGKCEEQEMELSKIAKIRGDAYTDLFIEGAKRARKRGKKVYVTLNVEMLYDPIPYARHMAYPMNVEWQWEKWLEEIKPDEINIRSYQMSPEFMLKDAQCMNFIKTAQKYHVPLTLERYDYWDFAKEFEMIRDTGIFDRMTLYETNDAIHSDGKGGIIEMKPELLQKLKVLTK